MNFLRLTTTFSVFTILIYPPTYGQQSAPTAPPQSTRQTPDATDLASSAVQSDDFFLVAGLLLENNVQQRVSQVAADKSTNRAVKLYAQRMIQAHNRLINTLRTPIETELSNTPFLSDVDAEDIAQVFQQLLNQRLSNPDGNDTSPRTPDTNRNYQPSIADRDNPENNGRSGKTPADRDRPVEEAVRTDTDTSRNTVDRLRNRERGLLANSQEPATRERGLAVGAASGPGEPSRDFGHCR